MDYIRRKVEQRIALERSLSGTAGVLGHLRVRLEYVLFLTLAYLWNRNLKSADAETREGVIAAVQGRPSIGTILAVARRLDLSREVFTDRQLGQALDAYPNLRNHRIGHGYTLPDGADKLADDLQGLYERIVNAPVPLLAQSIDLVWVAHQSGAVYNGLLLSSDGSERPWACNKNVGRFLEGNTYGYAVEHDQYFRLSPFIHITLDEQRNPAAYVFAHVQEPLVGSIRYNRVINTGDTLAQMADFREFEVENDGERRRTANGTVLNVFQPNYGGRYLDTPIKQRIRRFLLKHQSAAYATVWGHGGVGKTAAVQRVCEELGVDPERHFDYVVFVSAKDRYYDYYTGKLRSVERRVQSFAEIARMLNRIVFREDHTSLDDIAAFSGKLLVVIDDYETLGEKDREHIEDFVHLLNPAHHRVLITTRANLSLGEQLRIEELSVDETVEFLMSILRTEYSVQLDLKRIAEELSAKPLRKRVREITGGRPLFVLQLASLIPQRGSVEQAVSMDLGRSHNAIQFLYGRIYDSLSPHARDLYCAISQIVSAKEYSFTIEHLRFVAHLEEQDLFDRAVSELVNLKLLDMSTDDVATVTVPEIVDMMTREFASRDSAFRNGVLERVRLNTAGGTPDQGAQMLAIANAARITEPEDEVVKLYRSVLYHRDVSDEAKREALLALADYLAEDRGKPALAIEELDSAAELVGDLAQAVFLQARLAWQMGTEDSRERGAQMLLAWLAQAEQDDPACRIEGLALLVDYRGALNIERKEQLKADLRFGRVDETVFSQRNHEIRETFGSIADREGRMLLDTLESLGSIAELAQRVRRTVSNGLLRLCDVFLRQNQFDEAEEVCHLGADALGSAYGAQFGRKAARVNAERARRY